MQEALLNVTGKRATLTRCVHEDLSDFRWIADDRLAHPTYILKLVPLTPTLTGNHDASRYMCGRGMYTRTHRNPTYLTVTA